MNRKLSVDFFLRRLMLPCAVLTISVSVAQSADIRQGDRIVRAAGVDVTSSATLVAIIARQSPGTWLPVIIERAGQEIEVVAKFPAAQGKTP